MPNYANAKIYQVISPNHPVPYIGSTTMPLCKRMAEHRAPSNECRSRILIEAGDAYIELIEEYPCENKEQLNKREGEVIRQRECVNRLVAGRTKAEYREENREAIYAHNEAYYEANKEAIIAQHKAYREANREAINARKKAYREANREAIHSYMKAYRKAYREANREAINARRRAYRASKKAKASVDVLPQQGQEDFHRQPNEAPQPL